LNLLKFAGNRLKMNANKERQFLSYKEVANLLGVSVTTLHRMREQGLLTPIRWNSRLVKFDRADILLMVDSMKTKR